MQTLLFYTTFQDRVITDSDKFIRTDFFFFKGKSLISNFQSTKMTQEKVPRHLGGHGNRTLHILWEALHVHSLGRLVRRAKCKVI